MEVPFVPLALEPPSPARGTVSKRKEPSGIPRKAGLSFSRSWRRSRVNTSPKDRVSMGWGLQDQKVGRTGRELEADNILGGCACPRLSWLSQRMHTWPPVMPYYLGTNMTLDSWKQL
jgi:hypothetical protein